MPAFIFIKFKSKIEKITMEKSIIFIKFRSKVEKNMKHLCLKLIKMLYLPPYDVWRKQKISNFIKLQILPPWDFFLQFWTTIVQPSNPLQSPLWYTDRQIEQSVHGLTSLKSEYLALSTMTSPTHSWASYVSCIGIIQPKTQDDVTSTVKNGRPELRQDHLPPIHRDERVHFACVPWSIPIIKSYRHDHSTFRISSSLNHFETRNDGRISSK